MKKNLLNWSMQHAGILWSKLSYNYNGVIIDFICDPFIDSNSKVYSLVEIILEDFLTRETCKM